MRSLVMLLSGLAALSLAAVLGWRLASSAPAPVSPADPIAGTVGESVASLREALDAEASARVQLEAKVDVLWELVESSSPVAAPDAPGEGTTREEKQALPAAEESEGFDSERLGALDLPPSELARLRKIHDEIELERLYLSDRAAREGWLFSTRHQLELRELNESYRDEYGDDAYDTMLYVAGKPNRVEVTRVLGGSSAARAGLEPRDLILSYAGRRTFTQQELRRATTEGRAGETIRVEVLRGSRVLTMSVSRGPMGVVLRPRHRLPGYGE